MTAHRQKDIVTKRRTVSRETMVRISPLPPPEEVFIDWLLSLPTEDCLEAAARYQIKTIDRSAVVLHPHVRQLRNLLVAVLGDSDWRKPSRISEEEFSMNTQQASVSKRGLL